MAADLSDDEIDRLLSEAESRLASKASHKDASTPKESCAQISIAAGTDNVTSSEENDEPRKQKQPELLSVRVPQLAAKKNKAVKDDAGPDWFNMPRTELTPELKRDLQLLRMRSILNPKQFFKKDTRKDPVPEFCQVGTIVEGRTEFFSGRLTRKERKRTLVEEVLASHDTLAKFKTQYDKVQERKTSGKKAHYKKLMAQRRRRG